MENLILRANEAKEMLESAISKAMRNVEQVQLELAAGDLEQTLKEMRQIRDAQFNQLVKIHERIESLEGQKDSYKDIAKKCSNVAISVAKRVAEEELQNHLERVGERVGEIQNVLIEQAWKKGEENKEVFVKSIKSVIDAEIKSALTSAKKEMKLQRKKDSDLLMSKMKEVLEHEEDCKA